MQLGPDGVGVGMNMLIRWSDLKEALTRLLGYSYLDRSKNHGGEPVSGTVTGATDANPIEITTSAPHQLTNTPKSNVLITEVRGNLPANGVFTATVTGASTFTIVPDNQTGTNTYTAGTGEWRTVGTILRRNIPWQHPFANQLYVKAITDVRGVRLSGRATIDTAASLGNWNTTAGAVGVGSPINSGPWTAFDFAILTIQFWRPPYYIRTDADIGVDSQARPREWLRYTSKMWEMSSQMLSRSNSAMIFSSGQGSPPNGPGDGNTYTGAVGQQITNHKVIRKWYQVPEAALFLPLTDSTPNGMPWNLVYMQTKTINPITGYFNIPGQPITGTVNVPIGGILQFSAPYLLDNDPSQRFFGCYMGTLMYGGCIMTPAPLQLPPEVMKIPVFTGNEPIAQNQYDVEFHFEMFDPPRSPMTIYRGHNLVPWSSNALWYATESQNVVNNTRDYTNHHTTPFQYADFSDLFQPI